MSSLPLLFVQGGSNKQRFDPLKLLSDSPEMTRSQQTAPSSPPLITVSSSQSQDNQKLPTVMEEMSLGKNKVPTSSGADRPKKVSPSSNREDTPRQRTQSLGKSASSNPSRNSGYGTGPRKPVSASTSRLSGGSSQPQKPVASRHTSSTTKLPKSGSIH